MGETYQHMRREGIEATAVTFNSVLDILVRQLADPAQLQDIVDDMQAASVPADVVTYSISILVKMYGKASLLDKAIELSKLVEREYDMKPNLHVFTCLIQACVRNRRIRKSWELFGD